MNPDVRRQPRGDTRRRWRSWIGAGVLVVVGLLLLVVQWREARPALPKALGTLALQEVMRGADAQELLNRMHAKDVTPLENVIGVYRGTEGTATLYASFYDDRRIARLEYERMGEMIRARRSVFSHLTQGTIDGSDVSTCMNMNQPQYFFPHEYGLYWLSTDQEIGDSTVVYLLRALKN